MKAVRKIIEINEALCNGCGNCIVSCAENALQIVEGKAKLREERYCDGLGACLGDCPTGALKVIERYAEDFDEEAVAHNVVQPTHTPQHVPETLPCGCPSTHLQTFAPKTACNKANQPVSNMSTESALSHWPVQIRLVPAGASFLRNADLLVVADCTAIAYPDFHRDLLPGKTVLMGCPKFDDVQPYVEKFTEIFQQANIRSITTVVMEVPCCQGLPVIVKKAMDLAGKKIPMEYLVIGVQGDVLKKERLVA